MLICDLGISACAERQRGMVRAQGDPQLRLAEQTVLETLARAVLLWRSGECARPGDDEGLPATLDAVTAAYRGCRMCSRPVYMLFGSRIWARPARYARPFCVERGRELHDMAGEMYARLLTQQMLMTGWDQARAGAAAPCNKRSGGWAAGRAHRPSLCWPSPPLASVERAPQRAQHGHTAPVPLLWLHFNLYNIG